MIAHYTFTAKSRPVADHLLHDVCSFAGRIDCIHFTGFG